MHTTYFSAESFSRFTCRDISDAAKHRPSVDRYGSARCSPCRLAQLDIGVACKRPCSLDRRLLSHLTSPLPSLSGQYIAHTSFHFHIFFAVQHELWATLPGETIGRIVSFMTLHELSHLRSLNRHWRESIDSSIRTLRLTSMSSIPTRLFSKFLHLEHLTVEHMDETHYCDMRQLNLVTALRYLSIQGMKLSNDSLISIGRCQSLTELSVADITLTKNCSEALSALTQLTQLTKLCMRYIDVEKVEFGGDCCVESVSKIHSLKHLELRFDMSTEVLENLSALTGLETLCLSSITLYIPDLYFLKSLTRLRHLSLPWTHFAIYDTKQIDLLSNLTFLDLGATDVTDDSVQDFSRLTNLRHLSLKDACIGDATVEHLSGMTDLVSLDISHGAGLSDVCSLDHISELHSLKSLNLNGTHIGDSDLEMLRPLSNLERLDIGLTCVTEAGIKTLASISSLKEVNTEIVRNHFDHY